MQPLIIRHISDDCSAAEILNNPLPTADQIAIESYWSGDIAPEQRHATVNAFWSSNAIFIVFVANQFEPLIVKDQPDLLQKTPGLWNYDVCEAFISPGTSTRGRYFEFEVAPTGEWVDLAIEVTPAGRNSDLAFDSGMTVAVQAAHNSIKSAMKIPWKAFGIVPANGDVWLGNLFRCIGGGDTRGYLAWRPTRTAAPNFHVPEAFGEFHFVR
jgi:alpha-galactosidase